MLLIHICCDTTDDADLHKQACAAVRRAKCTPGKERVTVL